MPTKPADTIYDALTDEDFTVLGPLFSAFEDNPFKIGDYINGRVWGSTEYQKVAERYDVRINRIRLFAKVAAEVKPSKRTKGVAFGVYEWLIKITDPDERWKLLASKSAADWRIEDMKAEVTRALAKKAQARPVLKAGNRLGGYKIDLELEGDELIVTVWAKGQARLLDVGTRKAGMAVTLG